MSHKRRFIDDEAAASGDEADHQDDFEEAPENAEDRAFINDETEFIPSAPPPIFNIPAFDNEEEPLEIIEDLSRAVVPYVPPVISRPVPPVPKQGGGNTPPPAKPPAKPTEKFIRPKCNASKRLVQILASTVIPACQVGSLTFNLVTVIPDYERSLEESWKAVENERALIMEQVSLLPGLFCAFTALETHPGSRPKAPDAKNPKKKKGDGAVLDETPDDNNEGANGGETITITKKNRLAGKPHFHILLFYSDLHFPRLDLSVFKRRLMLVMPKSDVNEKVLPEGIRNKNPHYVRALTYVLKGVDCPSTADFWKKFVAKEPDSKPPLPEFYHGVLFGQEANDPLRESTQRFIDMLDRIQPWCKSDVPFGSGSAAPQFREEARRSREQKDMICFAQLMRTLGIFVGGATYDKFFRRLVREDYPVCNTYTEGFDFCTLQRQLSYCPQAIEFMLRYKERLTYWFKFQAIFQHVPTHKYEWVELRDGYYNIRTGLFHPKTEPFYNVCFRAYSYSMDELRHDEPTEWLELLDFMCRPHVDGIIPDPKDPRVTRTISRQVDKKKLLDHLALLLRPRFPKQAVPFLYGASNSGKSTLISWVVDLYPNAARGFLNSSVAALSGIHEDIVILHCDEFKTDLISREDLLILLDGAQPLTVRRYHQDARQINNPLMPIILADNFKPAYYNDDSKALENRMTFFEFRNELVPDNNKATLIREKHLLIVRYLNDYLLRKAQH